MFFYTLTLLMAEQNAYGLDAGPALQQRDRERVTETMWMPGDLGQR
jgi:hypothetical protein